MKTNEELKHTPNLLIVRTAADGGMGEIFKLGKRYGSVIWSTVGGWEHVSVCPYNMSYTQTGDDICALKDMFFFRDETVVQYHPANRKYVNNMPNCLHLWRPIETEHQIPPAIMAGINKGRSKEDIIKAIEEIYKNWYG